MARHGRSAPVDAPPPIPAARIAGRRQHARRLEIKNDLPVVVQVTTTKIVVSSAFVALVKAIYVRHGIAQAAPVRILRLMVMYLGEHGVGVPARVSLEQFVEAIRLTLITLADIDSSVELAEAFYA